jgi:hypothetical protein
VKSSVRCNSGFAANAIGESNVKIAWRCVIITPRYMSLSPGEFAGRQIVVRAILWE